MPASNDNPVHPAYEGEDQDLPGFLIIGAMKSGTTFLHALLRQHPQISMAKLKEPNFFNRSGCLNGTWDRGLGWYKALFKSPGLKGEASTGYTKFPQDDGVAERIFQTLPHVRFIYLVRNPINRAISHYLHNVLRDREKRSIHSALLADPANIYVTTGLYHLQMEQYLRRFPRERFYVIAAESLWQSPALVLKSVLSFLQLEALLPFEFEVCRHSTIDLYTSLLLRGQPPNQAGQILREALLAAKPNDEADAHALGNQLGFGQQDRKLLAELFREDVQRLRHLLGDPFNGWRPDFPLGATSRVC